MSNDLDWSGFWFRGRFHRQGMTATWRCTKCYQTITPDTSDWSIEDVKCKCNQTERDVRDT